MPADFPGRRFYVKTDLGQQKAVSMTGSFWPTAADHEGYFGSSTFETNFLV